MKKAKLMLTAVAVMAVVGGALAFKAVKFQTNTFYCTTTTNSACTVADLVQIKKTIDPTGVANTYCSDATHSGGTADPCPFISLKNSN
jgi:hypothetical protein